MMTLSTTKSLYLIGSNVCTLSVFVSFNDDTTFVYSAHCFEDFLLYYVNRCFLKEDKHGPMFTLARSQNASYKTSRVLSRQILLTSNNNGVHC